MSRRSLVSLLTLCIIAGAAAAETVYVTDKLYLGLHEDPGGQGRQLGTLVSGTRLEVLDRRKHYAKVRTPDGTVGWTKSAYLVTEIPPRLQLEQLSARNSELQRQLQSTRASLDKTRETNQRLQSRVSALEQQTTDDTQALERLRNENQHYRAEAAARGTRVPLSWAGGAALVCLVAGFGGGLAWLDRRIRKRHGGFRIH